MGVINRLCLFVQKRQRSRGGSIPAGPPFTGGRRESLPLPEGKKRLKRAQFCLPICWMCCKDPDNAGPCHLDPSPSCVPEVCGHRDGGRPPIQSSNVVRLSPTRWRCYARWLGQRCSYWWGLKKTFGWRAARHEPGHECPLLVCGSPPPVFLVRPPAPGPSDTLESAGAPGFLVGPGPAEWLSGAQVLTF